MSEKIDKLEIFLVEWGVWGSLTKIKDHELILLKGHLLLDTLLSPLNRNLSFYAKTKLLEKIDSSNKVCEYLFEINKIRNKVAHEFFFDLSESDFKKWAIKVTNEFEPTYFTKKTERLLLVHAFSALGKEIYQIVHENITNKPIT